MAPSSRLAFGDITNVAAQRVSPSKSKLAHKTSERVVVEECVISPEKPAGEATELYRALRPRRKTIEKGGSMFITPQFDENNFAGISVLQASVEHSPPSIVLEYIQGVKRCSHQVPICSSSLQLRTKELAASLRQHAKHGPFLRSVPEQQLVELIKSVKASARLVEKREEEEAACENTKAPVPDTHKFVELRPVGARGGVAAGSASRRGRSGPAGADPRQPHANAKDALRATAHGRLLLPAGRCTLRPCADKTAGSKKICAWPADAWAKWSLAEGAQNTEGALESGGLQKAFEFFRTSRGVPAIAQSFAQLLHAATDAGKDAKGDGVTAAMMPLDTIRSAVGSQQRFARGLWERLDARWLGSDYEGRALSGQRAVIVGAGPVGLRCALELRLLGAEVIVLERRTDFERINRLHLWSWAAEDLKGWGAKILEPPDLSFGADPDFLHIGISELQMLLLKPCLLLGVQVFFGVDFLGTSEQHAASSASNSPQWSVLTAPSSCVGAQKVAGPVAPSELLGVSILVGADGPRGSVAKAQVLKLNETTGLRKEAALGLVANYSNLQSQAEKGRRSFSLARQFYGPLFEACEKETGVELENVVCYIATNTHYFVMTPTRKSLQELGVLQADAPDGELLSTLNSEALVKAARAIAAFPWKPEQPLLPQETLDAQVGPPALFDFSRTRRAAEGIRIAETTPTESGDSAQMLVGLCGDALIEPFWPEGLGIMRGFFAALDLASAAKVWAETRDASAAEAHFESAYRQLKSVAAKTRSAVLRPDLRTYGLAPASRYRAFGSRKVVRASSVPNLR